MKSYRIEVAPRARSQLMTILAWWAKNRPASPTVVLEEFDHVVELLAKKPGLVLSTSLDLVSAGSFSFVRSIMSTTSSTERVG